MADDDASKLDRSIEAVARSRTPLEDLADPNSSLHRLIDSLPMAVVGIDLDMKVICWSPAAERLFGWRADEVMGRTYPLAVGETQGHEARSLFGRVRGGTPFDGDELTRTRKDGRQVDLAVWSHALRNARDEPVGALGFMVDLTDRKRIEREYRGLFENAHDAIVIFRPRGEIVLDVNSRACEVYGFTRKQFVGLSMRDLSLDPERGDEQVQQTLQATTQHRFQTRHRIKNGDIVDFEINASIVEFQGEPAILSINRDVTDRARLEAQARQAQKMEALGQMAGGVAHDFNNLLTALLGYPELIRKSLPAGHPARAYLTPMEEAAGRAAEMTRHLLAFSRGQVVDMGPVDVDEAVGQMRTGLHDIAPDSIQIEFELAAQGAKIQGHRAELERILSNLVHNAIDAMPEGGTVRVETSVRASTSDPHVHLRVSDDGAGMSQEVQAQVFEPFFTTKVSGRGTGLGLSTVYGIVKQHGGTISVASAPGQGTRFDLSFPVLELGESSTQVPTRPRTPSITEGDGVVLVVEDDDVVRTMAQRALTRAGYRVFVTDDGQEALAFVRGGATLDLVVSDILMPNMSGAELHQALQSLRPGLPILLMSGYAGRDDHQLPDKVAFLHKPFRPSELTARVGELIAAARKRDA